MKWKLDAIRQNLLKKAMVQKGLFPNDDDGEKSNDWYVSCKSQIEIEYDVATISSRCSWKSRMIVPQSQISGLAMYGKELQTSASLEFSFLYEKLPSYGMWRRFSREEESCLLLAFRSWRWRRYLFLFLVSWDWVFWYCGHYWPIVPVPDDRWWWLWRN
jgi:hypothetical protein